MIGSWQTLSRFLHEAKSAADYKKALFALITKRFGEHEADELAGEMARSGSFAVFQKRVAMKYMSDEIDTIVRNMGQAAAAAKAAKEPKPAASTTAGAERGPSGRQFMDPQTASQKQAGIDAMRQARAGASVGSPGADKALMTPSSGKGGHDMSTAAAHKLKPQTELPPGVVPLKNDPKNGVNLPTSGLVDGQRKVDKLTKEQGAEQGDRLAAQLSVPTTAERTVTDEETGETKVQIWSSDRVLKFMDPDRNPDRQKPKGAPLPRAELIKMGILNRDKAAQQAGPNRPGSFPGERWKPHGREGEKLVSRPDFATGNWRRGKQQVNPKHTGQEYVWDGQKWVLPSVWAAKSAERKGQAPEPDDEEYPESDGWRKA